MSTNGKIKLKQIDGLENILSNLSNLQLINSDNSLLIEKTQLDDIVNFNLKVNLNNDEDNLIQITDNGLIVDYSMLKFNPDNYALDLLESGNGIDLLMITNETEPTKCKISVKIKEDSDTDYNFLRIDENGSLIVSKTELESKLIVPTINITNNIKESDTIIMKQDDNNSSIISLNVNISEDNGNLLKNQNGLFAQGDIINNINNEEDTISIHLENHNEYRFNNSVNTVKLSFPPIIKDNYISSIIFDSGNEFNETNLIINFDNIQYHRGKIECETNRRYNLLFYYDGKFMNCIWSAI